LVRGPVGAIVVLAEPLPAVVPGVVWPPPAVEGVVGLATGGLVAGDVPGVEGWEVTGGEVAGGLVTGGRLVGGVVTGGRVVGGECGVVVGGVVTGGWVVGGEWGRVVGGDVGMVLTGMVGGGENAGMAAECTDFADVWAAPCDAFADVWASECPVPGCRQNSAEPPMTTCPTTTPTCRSRPHPCRDIETTEDDIGGLPALLEHLPPRPLSIPPFGDRMTAWAQPECS
jgi:hypothetical protein